MPVLASQSTRGIPSTQAFEQDRVLVIGVGHLLVGDEGVGAHVVRRLQERDWPEHVSVVDGTAGGLKLLEMIQSAPRVVLIDASCDGLWPGSVTHFRAVQPEDFPPALSEHDLGMKALLTAASLLGDLPVIEVITISVDEPRPRAGVLNAEVRSALPEVERLVRQIAR